MKTRHGIQILKGPLPFSDPAPSGRYGLIDRNPLPEVVANWKIASDRHYPTRVLYRLQQGCCFYCGTHLTDAHAPEHINGYIKAHLYPRREGYALWANKVLAHRGCAKKWQHEMPTELHIAKFKRLYSDAVFEALYDRERGDL